VSEIGVPMIRKASVEQPIRDLLDRD